MVIGIYVGSFNPFHKGHMAAVEAALDDVDRVMIIPTPDYWDKKVSATISDRISNIKDYIEDNPNKDKIVIINSSGFKDMYDGSIYQLLKLFDEVDGNEVKLIMGSDTLLTLEKWKHVEELLKEYRILVMPRNNIDNLKYMLYLNSKYTLKGITVMAADQVDISSTEIRNKQKEKE